ncbi:MAG: Fumarylacetoacetate hydrolase [Thermoproteota archaeon]|nr:Fumarylacetoacetate hydrolase [Thermoproteota archaeon]
MNIARYQIKGNVFFGVVDNDIVKQIKGSPFDRITFTSEETPLSKVKILSPFVPSKILAIALNVKTHLHDRNAPTKPEPFYKVPSSVIGPGETIILPREAGRVEEEAELVAVIGKKCSKVSKINAMDYVLGYTCGNDVSCRDWQKGDIQWWRAKSSDTFGPIGPYIVTDIDPSNLNIVARVNGIVGQRCNTSELLFDLPTMISFISQVVTLERGDMIFTGTSGAPAQIRDGDFVEVEIEKIGLLSNPVKIEK